MRAHDLRRPSAARATARARRLAARPSAARLRGPCRRRRRAPAAARGRRTEVVVVGADRAAQPARAGELPAGDDRRLVGKETRLDARRAAQVLVEAALVGVRLAQPQALEPARREVRDGGDELQVLFLERARRQSAPRARRSRRTLEAGAAPANHSGAHSTARTLPSPSRRAAPGRRRARAAPARRPGVDRPGASPSVARAAATTDDRRLALEERHAAASRPGPPRARGRAACRGAPPRSASRPRRPPLASGRSGSGSGVRRLRSRRTSASRARSRRAAAASVGSRPGRTAARRRGRRATSRRSRPRRRRAAAVTLTRAPFRRVPLRLPRSRSSQPAATRTSSAWRRDSSTSGRISSQSRERPITTRSPRSANHSAGP